MQFPWNKKTPSVNSIDTQIDEINASIIDTNLNMIEYQNHLKMLEDKKSYLINLKTSASINDKTVITINEHSSESVATA